MPCKGLSFSADCAVFIPYRKASSINIRFIVLTTESIKKKIPLLDEPKEGFMFVIAGYFVITNCVVSVYGPETILQVYVPDVN